MSKRVAQRVMRAVNACIPGANARVVEVEPKVWVVDFDNGPEVSRLPTVPLKIWPDRIEMPA